MPIIPAVGRHLTADAFAVAYLPTGDRRRTCLDSLALRTLAMATIVVQLRVVTGTFQILSSPPRAPIAFI